MAVLRGESIEWARCFAVRMVQQDQIREIPGREWRIRAGKRHAIVFGAGPHSLAGERLPRSPLSFSGGERGDPAGMRLALTMIFDGVAVRNPRPVSRQFINRRNPDLASRLTR